MTSSFADTASHDTHRPPRKHAIRRVAVGLLFAVNGLIIGGYGGVLPPSASGWTSTPPTSRSCCSSAGLAGIVAMQVGGRLVRRDRCPPSRPGRPSAPHRRGNDLRVRHDLPASPSWERCCSVSATEPWTSPRTLWVFRSRAPVSVPVMSSFHALWSVGGFVGAGSVLLMATRCSTSKVLRSSCRSCCSWQCWLSSPSSSHTRSPHQRRSSSTALTAHGRRSRRSPGCSRSSALAFGLSEGTATDWSALARHRGCPGRLHHRLARSRRGQWLHGHHPPTRRPSRRSLRPRAQSSGSAVSAPHSATAPSPWSAAYRCCSSVGHWSDWESA